jgi:hypothetical protein
MTHAQTKPPGIRRAGGLDATPKIACIFLDDKIVLNASCPLDDAKLTGYFHADAQNSSAS